MNDQAVFVQAGRASGIEPLKPMRSGSLNDKLPSLCTMIGILDRNTYYSFRRTAIIETRRDSGLEGARELAFHALNK